MATPNLKSLKVFCTVARRLNFRLAAEELHVTRGAVAQQIRQLEEDLGVTLFNRLRRGLSLTPKAEAYYNVLKEALQTIDEATRIVSATSNKVIVTMTPSMAGKWLLPRLSDFEQQYPDIDLQVVTSDNLNNFDSEGIDIGIRYGNPLTEKSLLTEHLISLNLIAVCSPDYAKKHCGQYLIDHLQSTYQVSDPTQFVIDRLIQDKNVYWESWLESMQLPQAKRVLVLNQTSLAIDAAIGGKGITLAASILVRDHLSRGELVALWEHTKLDNQGYYLAYKQKDKAPDTAVIAVRHWLRKTLAASAN